MKFRRLSTIKKDTRERVEEIVPLRIAIVSTTFLPVLGGVQVVLQGLLEYLENNFGELSSEYELETVAFLLPNNFQSDRLDSLQNVSVHYFGFSPGFVGFWRARREIARTLSHLGSNVVHGHNVALDGLLFGAIPRRRVKILTTHGGDLGFLREHQFGVRLKFLGKIAVRLALLDTTMLIGVSRTMGSFAAKVFPRSRIRILPNADFFSLSFRAETPIIHDFGIYPEMLVVLTVGGGRSIKGHENLLKAFAIFGKSNPRARLFVGSSGPEIDRLPLIADKLGIARSVRFIGEVSGTRKLAIFDRADIYANTSFFEGFGITTFEAIGSQTALLASKVGGLEEMLDHLENAFLVNPQNVEEILEGLRYLSVRKHRKTLVKKAEVLLKDYEPGELVRRQLRLYKEALGPIGLGQSQEPTGLLFGLHRTKAIFKLLVRGR